MLKTLVVYKNRKPDDSELLEMFPILDITYTRTRDRLQTVYDEYYKIFTLSWSWFASLFPGDWDVRALVLNEGDLNGIGINDHWGFYSLENDGTHDFYMTDLRTLHPKAIANGFKTNFAWMFLHELLHGLVWAMTGNREMASSLVHEWEKQGILKLKVMEHLARYYSLQVELNKQTSIWEKLMALFIKPKPTMIHPLDLPYRNIITQKYGVPHTRYKKTGHHVKTDYGTPIGTPVRAPKDGEVIEAKSSPERGLYVYFKFDDVVLEFCHLSRSKKLGKYKQGDVIAYTGNSGNLTTGPHVCHGIWKGSVRLNEINRDNWRELTIDPEVFYASVK